MFLLSVTEWQPDELNAIAAIASAAAAMIALFVAALTAFYQRKSLQHAWESNSASMVTKFVDDWQSAHFRHFRKRFANQLLEVRKLKSNDPQAVEFIQRIGIVDVPVLGFLENVAYLTRRGVLDRGMVWNKFFWEVERYYIAITHPANLINEWRRGDQTTIYCEIEWLYRNLLPYDREQRNLVVGKGGPDASEMTTFLKEESNLEILSV